MYFKSFLIICLSILFFLGYVKSHQEFYKNPDNIKIQNKALRELNPSSLNGTWYYLYTINLEKNIGTCPQINITDNHIVFTSLSNHTYVHKFEQDSALKGRFEETVQVNEKPITLTLFILKVDPLVVYKLSHNIKGIWMILSRDISNVKLKEGIEVLKETGVEIGNAGKCYCGVGPIL